MGQLAKRLDRRDHPGHDIIPPQHASDFGLDAIPSTGGKFTKQFAIETSVNSQTFGNGKNYLPMRDRQTNIFAGTAAQRWSVDASHERTFLVT